MSRRWHLKVLYICLNQNKLHYYRLYIFFLKMSETAWSYSNIAALLALQSSRIGETEEYIKDALSIYRDLDIKYPGQYQSSEARTTVLYARLLSRFDARKKEAILLYNKALELYKSLNLENSGIYAAEINTIKTEITNISRDNDDK